MKYASTIVVSLLMGMLLTACGKPTEVSFNTLETARTQAAENAEYNAKKYRTNNPAAASWGIIGRGDSAQTPTCPQGDGWASLNLVDANGAVQRKLKCSTVSSAVGCLEDGEFKTSLYGPEDKVCQSTAKVPFPVPSISK